MHMDRKDFFKRISAGALLTFLPNFLSANENEVRTGKKHDQLGINHLPNREKKTMNTVLHKAETRGHANHGWLDSHHTFSFANYYNSERIHFGALRVLNDDVVSPSKGFGTHPHDNMEIISIPLEGDLQHKDSMGNVQVIKSGDVQVMSAGTGIFHSEYNKNDDKDVKFLQIWVFSNKRDVQPRYDQISLREIAKRNEFYQVLSPNSDDQGVWIHQSAWFHLGEFDKGVKSDYQFHNKENGVYTFVIDGELTINGQLLSKRDGFGVWNTDKVEVETQTDAKVLLMEVPMQR